MFNKPADAGYRSADSNMAQTSGLATDAPLMPETRALAEIPDTQASRTAGSFRHAKRVVKNKGIQTFVIACPGVKADSAVVASIAEVLPWPWPSTPFVGNAHMAVLNACPFGGDVNVRVNVVSDKELTFQVSVIYST